MICSYLPDDGQIKKYAGGLKASGSTVNTNASDLQKVRQNSIFIQPASSRFARSI
jgi:hypothetical protein